MPPKLVRAVLDEIRERGPLSARELTDHGAVEPIDWSGWKGTSKATSMALEILWTRCDIVVAGRTESGAKIYDVPERAFGDIEPPRRRVRALGLARARARGGTAHPRRRLDVVDARRRSNVGRRRRDDRSRRAGRRGDRRLAAPLSRRLRRSSKTKRVRYDDRVRILGPLDPLLGTATSSATSSTSTTSGRSTSPRSSGNGAGTSARSSIATRLIGRIDARVEGNTLVVKKLWLEGDGQHDDKRDAIRGAGASRGTVRRGEECGCRGGVSATSELTQQRRRRPSGRACRDLPPVIQTSYLHRSLRARHGFRRALAVAVALTSVDAARLDPNLHVTRAGLREPLHRGTGVFRSDR